MVICNAKDFPEMPPAKSSPEMLEPFTRALPLVTECAFQNMRIASVPPLAETAQESKEK